VLRDPILVSAAAALLAACGAIAGRADPVAHGPALLPWVGLATAAWLAAWRRLAANGARGFGPVVAVAAFARLLLLLPDVPLSDDLYRYLWDGRVANAGTDPYRFPPDAEELVPLRDAAVWPRVNHPDVPTVYPPLAQLSFRALDAVAPDPRAPRVAAAALDVLATALLGALLRRRGRAAAQAVAYGWCPLAILESAGGGHVDVLGVTLLLGGLLVLSGSRPRSAGASFGAGVLLAASALVKPAAVLLAPILAASRVPRRGALLAGAVAPLVLWIPHLDEGPRVLAGLRTYAEHWQFNDALYSVLVHAGLLPRRARLLLAAALLLAAIVAARRGRDLWAASATTMGALLVASPTVHPWYGLWLAPVLPFLPGGLRPAGIALCALLPLSYATAWRHASEGVWREPVWVRAVEWGSVGLLLLAAAVGARSRGRAAVSARAPGVEGGA
jgi:hypothetical protein